MTHSRNLPLGFIALFLFGLHETAYALRGIPENGLWACHVSVLAIGAGLLIPSAIANAVGTFWLTAGFPLWIYYVTTASDIVPTTFATHIGGLVLGYAGIRRLGLPAATWWVALAGLALLALISRAITAPAENINLSHGIWAESSGVVISSYGLYLLFFFVVFTAIFLALQLGLPRLGFPRSR
jgi:hypothetical protein